MSLKLCKSGYGSYAEILNTSVDIVFKYIHYENFINDYQQEFTHLNKGDK